MRNPSTSVATLLALVGTLQAAADLQAETHRFVPTAFHAVPAASHAPVLRIRSGDRVVTATSGEPQSHTGPFLVHEAEPGDLLVVTFDVLEPAAVTGYSMPGLAPNALEPGSLQGKPRPVPQAWAIDRQKGVVRLDLADVIPAWRARFASQALELPLRPMLGSVTLGSPGRTASEPAVLGPSGGPLSFAGLTAGTSVMLRVDAPGALLYLGHGQARRGDGGLTGSGITTPLSVEFRVELVKKREWPHSSVVRPSTVVGEFEQAWPRLETADAVSTVASAPTLQQALQRATLELHHWLDDDFGLSEQSVSLLLGQLLEIDVADAGGSTSTVVTRVRKANLPQAAPAPAPDGGPR